jgi:hypothetical protein
MRLRERETGGVGWVGVVIYFFNIIIIWLFGSIGYLTKIMKTETRL